MVLTAALALGPQGASSSWLNVISLSQELLAGKQEPALTLYIPFPAALYLP